MIRIPLRILYCIEPPCVGMMKALILDTPTVEPSSAAAENSVPFKTRWPLASGPGGTSRLEYSRTSCRIRPFRVDDACVKLWQRVSHAGLAAALENALEAF